MPTQRVNWPHQLLQPEEVGKLAASVLNGDGRPIDGLDTPTPCTEKWRNLSEEAVKKMWGVFMETGIFLAACRHGTVLLMCDMIWSGELLSFCIMFISLPF